MGIFLGFGMLHIAYDNVSMYYIATVCYDDNHKVGGNNMDGETLVSIKISGKLSYEDNITLSQAAQIIAFIDSSTSGSSTMPAAVTRLAPTALISSSIVKTPREALEDSGAKTNAEKIVAFAGTVLDEGQKETFTLEDVRPLFRRAREITPKNLSRDLDGAIRANWVAEGDEKGDYYLTKKALEVLETGFSKVRATHSKSTSTPTSKKPRRTGIEMPDEFKSVDPIPASVEDYPDYFKLTKDQDRFLWVLALAKHLNLDGLDNKAIAWVTDQLGHGIELGLIGSKLSAAKNSGRANRSTQTGKIRITTPGEEYLKGLLAGEEK